MLKVEALIKYLSENNPQSTPVRLAFFNYLSNLAEPQALVTPELLESFFTLSLDYAHWQQNREQLGSEIQELLNDHVDFTVVKMPKQSQVIELENLNDATDALQCYLNTVYKKGEKYRLILEGDKKILAIILLPDQTICVQTFDRKMVIRHGQLEPLKKDLVLYYNSNLELDPNHIQRLEVGPFVTAQFQLAAGGVQGCLVRGYQHQKFFDLQGDSLAAYPKLFYSIKRIEQYFLQRQSDPFYQETVAALEKTIDRMRLNDMDSFQESVDVMARAQNILEYVFTGDKLLNLLIRDLQHTLSQKNSRVVRTPQKVEESWNPLKAQTLSPQNNPRPQTPNPNKPSRPQTDNRISPLSSNRMTNSDEMELTEELIPLTSQKMDPKMSPTNSTKRMRPMSRTEEITEDLLQDLLGSDLTN
jgi:hypothetical protein